MALLMAQALRTRAREAVLGAGGRGFVRFAEDALLATDAARRCDAAALMAALAARGFACRAQGGLLLMTPQDALLRETCAGQALMQIDWRRPLCPAQALARRLQACPALPLTAAGRELLLSALRATGMPGADVCAALDALRGRAAVMLRAGDRSGMRESGAVLAQWCRMKEDAQ